MTIIIFMKSWILISFMLVELPDEFESVDSVCECELSKRNERIKYFGVTNGTSSAFTITIRN